MCRPMIWTGGKSLQNQNLSDLSGQIRSIQELLAEERNASDRIQKLDGDIAHLRKSILLEWLGQARQLWIAAERHRLKGKHFSVFAMQIGIDRSSAYELLKLRPHRAEISKRCRCANHWPGWEVVAGWYKGDKNHMADTDLDRPATRNKGLLTPTWQRRKVSDDEYGTPQALFDHYDRIHHFTCDVAASAALAKCEKFFDKATDGLAQTWTGVYWMNPPYGADDDRKRQLGRWVHKAHEASQQGDLYGITDYADLARDVRRTLAIAAYASPSGQRFDAIGVDIEYLPAGASPAAWNQAVATHLARVRAGTTRPLVAIVLPPVLMRLFPDRWGTFPWPALAANADAVAPMGYWTSYTPAPRCAAGDPQYCAYQYTRDNVLLARQYTGLPVQIIGGSGDTVTLAQVADYARAARETAAAGGSFYDYLATKPGFWAYLAQLARSLSLPRRAPGKAPPRAPPAATRCPCGPG